MQFTDQEIMMYFIAVGSFIACALMLLVTTKQRILIEKLMAHNLKIHELNVSLSEQVKHMHDLLRMTEKELEKSQRNDMPHGKGGKFISKKDKDECEEQ